MYTHIEVSRTMSVHIFVEKPVHEI